MRGAGIDERSGLLGGSIEALGETGVFPETCARGRIALLALLVTVTSVACILGSRRTWLSETRLLMPVSDAATSTFWDEVISEEMTPCLEARRR